MVEGLLDGRETLRCSRDSCIVGKVLDSRGTLMWSGFF